MDDSIHQSINLAQKWLPPILNEDKIAIMNILTGTEITFGTIMSRKYIELLRPYTDILGISGTNNQPRETDCVASGIVFFYCSLFYIMHFPDWGHHIHDILLYNVLYILVDHYIDDIHVNPQLKAQAISQMHILITDPLSHESMVLVDPILKTIAIIYNQLITHCPSTQAIITKLFHAEITGLHIQKDNTSSRHTYYDIASQKGGYTVQVLQAIVNNNDLNVASFELGTIMQLLDDMLDVLSDKENGIHTIATHDLEHTGNLDILWMDVINKIYNLDSQFTVFKILYTAFAVYIPDRLPQNYSTELQSLTNPLNLFSGCDASALLVSHIMDELIAIEVLEEMK